MYAAKKIGIKEIYSIGGAQAIAALAYGTKKIKKVDKIVGPGNIFVSTAKKHRIQMSIVDSVNKSNLKRPIDISKKIIKFFSNNVKNKSFALLGLSFKPNTDDIRDSTSIIIGNELIKAGAKIICYDPLSMPKTKAKFPKFIISLEASIVILKSTTPLPTLKVSA